MLLHVSASVLGRLQKACSFFDIYRLYINLFKSRIEKSKNLPFHLERYSALDHDHPSSHALSNLTYATNDVLSQCQDTRNFLSKVTCIGVLYAVRTKITHCSRLSSIIAAKLPDHCMLNERCSAGCIIVTDRSTEAHPPKFL